jgi:hypothetical protein
MLVSHIIDLVPIWLLFAATLLVMVFFIEYGFRLGKRAKAKAKKSKLLRFEPSWGRFRLEGGVQRCVLKH